MNATGYETYTREELVEMDTRMFDAWKETARKSDGNGLSAEIARASLRAIEFNRKAVNAEISKRAR